MVADGQTIAKRLSTSISKETKHAVKLVEEYNTTASLVTDSYIPVNVDEALDPDSDFWQPDVTSSSITWKTQKHITSAYLLIKRTEEELSLLQQEMQNVLAYCHRRKDVINWQIGIIQDKDELYSKGLKCLLLKMLQSVEQYHCTAKATFDSVLSKNDAVLSSEMNHSIDSESESDEDCDSFEGEYYDDV